MKTRNGWVSNSSSSSFVFFCDKNYDFRFNILKKVCLLYRAEYDEDEESIAVSEFNASFDHNLRRLKRKDLFEDLIEELKSSIYMSLFWGYEDKIAKFFWINKQYLSEEDSKDFEKKLKMISEVMKEASAKCNKAHNYDERNKILDPVQAKILPTIIELVDKIFENASIYQIELGSDSNVNGGYFLESYFYDNTTDTKANWHCIGFSHH